MDNFRIVNGDIFDQKTDVIVNPVNCVGVMGAGLAREFKRRYPTMFDYYRQACNNFRIKIGRVYIYQLRPGHENENPKAIACFPTKTHWAHNSQYRYIRVGMDSLIGQMKAIGLTSVAMPLVGAGHGKLDPEKVKDIIQHHARDTGIQVTLVVKPSVPTDDFRVLVCGGREFGANPDNQKDIHHTLDIAHKHREITTLIHGAARGVDTTAGEWAKKNGVAAEVYPARWDKYGRSAGYRRNQQMLDEGKPDAVIAFPGGKGTAHMAKLAEGNGIKVNAIPVWYPIINHPRERKDQIT